MDDKKTIIIGDTTRVEMTFEDVYHKYRGLLKSKAYRWSATYEYEEIFQVATIALWKAFEKYDLEQNPIPFGAVAATFIDYEILGYHAKHRPKFDRPTAQIKSVISLHSPIHDSKGNETEIEELVGEEEKFTQEVTSQIVLDKIFSKFSKQQRQDIWDYVNGYKLKELAASKSLSSQQVAARMQRTFAKFRVLCIKEMAL